MTTANTATVGTDGSVTLRDGTGAIIDQNRSMSSVHLNGAITTDIENRIRLIAAGGDAFTREAINRFLAVVSTPGVSTGQIIAAAAELKQALGASKAYYDVIGTLGDDLKRLIGDAVK